MANQQPRFIVIGAGMAGMLAGIKLRQAGYNDIVIYEKAGAVGGTWRENTYPGLTCDVPAHHYTYTFERNPDWSSYLAPGPEIQDYFERTAARYELGDCIEFNARVEQAVFEHGRWHLGLEDGRQDVADVVIAATGVLHEPRYPNICGITDFTGAIFHTARWDHLVELSGKRVAVTGMGSTGVQIVSELVRRGIRVDHFVRTPQWIMPVENDPYTEAQRALFRNEASALQQAMQFEEYQHAVERFTQALTHPGSEGAKQLGDACRANLASIPDAKLREQLTPDHEPLCKRLIFSPDYYSAIQGDCANLVRADIARIEAQGIRTVDGVLHEVDVIALATGFHTDRFMRPMKIVGRNGVDLEKLWKKRPVAYLSIAMPHMPNFFMLNGPNGPVGNFSLIDIAEHQWQYIEQLIGRIDSGEEKEICPTEDALEAYERDRIAAAKTTIWYTGGCNSWYLDAEGIPASWPWNYSRFVEEMRQPCWEAYGL